MGCYLLLLFVGNIGRRVFTLLVSPYSSHASPAKVESIAIKRHNGFRTRDTSKESLGHILSRWTLAYFSKLLCISIAIRVTYCCMREYEIDVFLAPPTCFVVHDMIDECDKYEKGQRDIYITSITSIEDMIQ
jgi:hypothetical protein